MSLVAPDAQVEIRSFSDGFLDTPDPARLPQGATPSAANAFFYAIGEPRPNEYGTIGRAQAVMGKRHGARLINASCISAGKRVDGLYEFLREGVTNPQLLAACNGSVYTWDGASTFTSIGTGFTAGTAVTFMTFRNLAFIMDGTALKVWDGTTYFTPGQIAPTAAPALAAVAPAGAGVTGTYQSLGVWYDSTHDHESSPSAYSAAVVFAAQDRQHTKPAGAPAANYDKWRIYVRRTDTNEVYFKLAAETVVGTATATEAVTDATRNLATTLLAPLPNQNDVPPTFAFMGTAQGYAFGVKAADSYVYVSANGDPQSYHPKDKIGVARGTAGAVTTCKAVGKRIIAQKGRRTYELLGDRMPFVPDELSGAYGNHSQDSSVEAADSYWCWDDEKGPYVTDLAGSWRSLVDGKIATIVGTVNKGANIRAAHLKAKAMVCWIVATGASTRGRTLLAYNYLVGAWLPPITGIEYGSIISFQNTDGAVDLYVGDQWGRVYQYFRDDVEGVPSGTTLSPITGAAANTVTAAAAAFYTTGDGLKGMPVAVVDASGTYWQWRTVQSNTGTQITIDTVNGTAWDRIPDTTFTVVVGGIDWFWNIPLLDFDKPMFKKRGCYVYAELRTSTSDFSLMVRGRLNDTTSPISTSDTFSTPQTAGVWGTGLWGTMLWGAGDKRPSKKRISRSFYCIQFEISNRYPNQPGQVVTFGVTADLIKGKMASGG